MDSDRRNGVPIQVVGAGTRSSRTRWNVMSSYVMFMGKFKASFITQSAMCWQRQSDLAGLQPQAA